MSKSGISGLQKLFYIFPVTDMWTGFSSEGVPLFGLGSSTRETWVIWGYLRDHGRQWGESENWVCP